MIDPANGINFNKSNGDVAKKYLERHSKHKLKAKIHNTAAASVANP